MASAAQEKHPQPWQLEEWKEAIRWFFLAAKEVGDQPKEEPAAWLPERSKGWPEWKVAFLTTVRRRKYSYRTEQSYLI
jgi:hypothetical protein